MRFRFYFGLITLLSCLNLHAQNIFIKGKVLDGATGSPFELANVVVQTSDSVFVSGVATDEKGNFKIDKLRSGNYRLIVSAIGYVSAVTELEGLSRSVDLGEIVLEEESELLDEVTVTASNVVNQADRRVIFPNKQQLAASTNGIDLLNTLQLPRINVNLMDNKVSLTTKETIQLRLNGVEVSEQEFMSVRPEDIIRIEYIENPGLRYGNVAAVLNYVTRRHESGGSVSFNVLQSLHRPFGNYNASFKANHKQSEWGFSYMGNEQKFRDIIRESEEYFYMEDGTQLTRREVANPGNGHYQNHRFLLNYNVQPSKNDYLNVTLGYSLYRSDKNYDNELHNSWYSQPVALKDYSDAQSNTPKLDVYWTHTFKNKQTLILNLVGTYIDTHNDYTYRETLADKPLTDILSIVDGEKYSFIGEAIYEKEWERYRLSAGLKHTQGSIDNQYAGTVAYRTKMKEANTYAYAQLGGKIKKLDYTIGVGVYRSWLKQEGTEGYETYTFRPMITLSYKPVDPFFIRINGTIENFAPSLSHLSQVEQYIDSFQIQRGNPDLKPYKSYKLKGDAEYRFGKNSFTLWGMYTNIPDVIMQEIYRDGNMFIHTNLNQRRIQQVLGSLTFKTRFLKDIFSLSVTGGVNHFISEGHTYHHQYTKWYYDVSLFANYKKWSLMYNQYSAYDTFWGEQVYGGKNGQTLLLTFRHKDLNVGVGMINPFTTTESETIVYNQYAPSRDVSSVRDASRMVVFQLSWNLNFGRKYQAKKKVLNNVDTDTGIMGR